MTKTRLPDACPDRPGFKGRMWPRLNELGVVTGVTSGDMDAPTVPACVWWADTAALSGVAG